MKRGFPSHSNAVWPTLPMTMFFVVIYGIMEGGFWLLKLLISRQTGSIPDDSPEADNVRLLILGIASACYAWHRLWRFHPACNHAYSQWLKMTPWTADKPLPIGPIQLVWQDVGVIGLLTAIAEWRTQDSPAVPVIVFGALYLGGLTFLLIVTRRWLPCLLLGFLWPALALPGIHGWLMLVILAAIIVVIWWGQRLSLRAFPWSFIKNFGRPGSILQLEIRTDRLTGAPTVGQPFNVGWPFLSLSPKANFYCVPLRSAISLSALFGWWSFCLIKASGMECLPGLGLGLAMVGAIFRVAIYCSGLTPSFNVWGRITSGRFVVPGFDRIFLTPTIVIMLAIAEGVVVDRSGSWYPVTEALMIASIFFVLFAGGPGMQSWVLTGWHRFRVPGQRSANKQLRPI